MSSSDLAWLQNWYRSNCDGEWEHSFGVHVRTIDNPGWRVTIDLKGTRYETLVAPPMKTDDGDGDWLQCFVKEVRFEGAGDASKLERILKTFREWIETWDRVHRIVDTKPDAI